MRPRPAGSDHDAWVGLLAVSDRRQQARHHLLRCGPAAVPAIRRGLGHPKPIVRQLCAGILDRLVDDESVPHLVAALDDDDTAVRARALHALACDQCKQNACRPGDELWIPRALELLGHPDADLRAAAIEALGKAVRRRPDVAAALATAADSERDRGLRAMARRFTAASRPDVLGTVDELRGQWPGAELAR